MNRRKFINQTAIASIGVAFIPPAKGFINNFSEGEYSASLPISISGKGAQLIHYWSFCVGAGRANEGLRASWQEQMKMAKADCNFQFCRFHGLFHDDMFVYRELNGKAAYNWQYIDDLFDRMLQIGVRPFVEMSFMPKDLASTSSTVFWWKGHISPPNDYAKWGGLVTAFTQHCVDRYGLEEVKKWFFEVWNEPDLHIFWDGTKSQYLELYKVSALAVKGVHKDLQVGGPATSNFVPDERFDGEREDVSKHKTFSVSDINTLNWKGVWIEDFLNYCHQEGLPVDFVSTHPYPTDYAIDPEIKKGGSRTREVNATLKDLKWLNEKVKKSAYPDAKIHLTEWSSSPSPRDPTHDSLQAAAYIIKVNIDCVGLADSLSYWTFTDVFEESGPGNSIYHGGFGLINYQGIVKPSFHAYRMLNRLGDVYLRKEEGICVTRHTNTGKMTALIYHYPPEMKDAVGGDVNNVLHMGQAKTFEFLITDLKPNAQFKVEFIDEQHGHGFGEWVKLGKPEPPTREQIVQIKKSAQNLGQEKLFADGRGRLNFKRPISPWTCMLIDEF